MKKFGMFIIAGVLALTFQACGNSNDSTNGMDNSDSMQMDNNTGTEGMGTDTMNMDTGMIDTTRMGDLNRTDTTGTGRPGMTP